MGILLEILAVIGRIIGEIFLLVGVEVLVKGPGYLIVKAFTRKKVDPDDAWVAMVGILFWLIVGLGIYAGYLTFVSADGE